jgi:uncharacterized protein (DUF1697 family)
LTKFIAILRGINVGGHRKILMADLKTLLSKNGMKEVATYIQSGNVVFASSKDASELEQLITNLIKQTYDFDVPVMVRSKEEWETVFEQNPFLLKDSTLIIDRLYVTFLGKEPTQENIAITTDFSFPNDEFKIIGRSVYILLGKKYSDTKLTNAFFESKLKVTATSRNWKTVTKLVELSL